jgi:hypothetical protein
LVFWAPQVNTDQNGNANLTFTATDDISSFLIRIESISIDGKTGIAEAIYQITF